MSRPPALLISPRRRCLQWLAVVALTLTLTLTQGLALAQAGAPGASLQRTVTLVVPYAAGGVTDTLARSLARRLAETWGLVIRAKNIRAD